MNHLSITREAALGEGTRPAGFVLAHLPDKMGIAELEAELSQLPPEQREEALQSIAVEGVHAREIQNAMLNTGLLRCAAGQKRPQNVVAVDDKPARRPARAAADAGSGDAAGDQGDAGDDSAGDDAGDDGGDADDAGETNSGDDASATSRTTRPARTSS